jgi:hypothetical protein
MLPFFIKSIVDDPLKVERDKTPVNISQCAHLRTSAHKMGDSMQKHYTIEFVGCNVVWSYYDVTSRNLEYELISNNRWEEYQSSTSKNVILND